MNVDAFLDACRRAGVAKVSFILFLRSLFFCVLHKSETVLTFFMGLLTTLKYLKGHKFFIVCLGETIKKIRYNFFM